MAVRPILTYPDPRLRERALPVTEIDRETRVLVEDMAETMYDAPGVGLAAPQIGESKRIFVVDITTEEEPDQLRVFINPEILSLEGSQTYKEGCLSFPGGSEDIRRAASVRVRATDLDGNQFELEASGLLAVAIQHENDHLDGVLMIDKLNPLKKRLLARRVEREKTLRDSEDPARAP